MPLGEQALNQIQGVFFVITGGIAFLNGDGLDKIMLNGRQLFR